MQELLIFSNILNLNWIFNFNENLVKILFISEISTASVFQTRVTGRSFQIEKCSPVPSAHLFIYYNAT